jgi:hypothetical protein
MNKDKLQQEMLAKIKPGTKPSDFKKKSKKLSPKTISPPPIEINKDQGYESDSSDKSVPIALPTPNQTIKDLQVQVSALQKQLQLYKDFREGDLKIKEDLKKSLWALTKDKEQQKQEIADLKLSRNKSEQKIIDLQQNIKDLASKNQELNKTISELKNQVKTKENTKQTLNEPQETKTFTCAECNQAKTQDQLSRVFNNFSFCLSCSKKARQQAQQEKQKPNPVDFICHLCEQNKTEIPNLIKLDKTLTDYLICSSCKPTAKEFNEADLITDDL